MISLIVMFLYFLGGQDAFKVYHTSGLVYWLLCIAVVLEFCVYIIGSLYDDNRSSLKN